MRKLIYIFISLVLVSCASIKEQEVINYEDVKHQEYEKLNEINLESYFLYFYSIHCSFCINIKPMIIEFSLEAEVFFVDVTDSSSHIASSEELSSFRGTPTLKYIYQQQVKMTLIGQREITSFLLSF